MRSILTDLGNVVTRFRFRAELVKEIITAFGVENLCLSEVFQVGGSILISDEGYYHGMDTGEFSVYDMWRRLTSHYKISRRECSYPLFLSLWCRHLVPIEEVVNLYCKLQIKFPLIAVSNGDSEGIRHLVCHLRGRYGLKFQEIFISAECKKKKPELLKNAIELLEKNGILPSNCVFVDDLLPYVQEARKLGIPAIEFNGSSQEASYLANELNKLGFYS